MFFLNLTAGEFFAILGTLGGLITALYLLDRTKRKKIVSTLRFWQSALTAEERQSRKRMREPWSLILQLLSLLLLLLAVAQLEWGMRDRAGRNHVLLLDTSAWTAERMGQGTLLDQEKDLAREYLARIPRQDRAMIVRAGGLTTPASTFTSDRSVLLTAIAGTQADFSALNLEQALSVARQAQSWSGGAGGEIVYIGPRLINQADPTITIPSNLRTISVAANLEDCGISRIGVRKNEDEANSWQAAVTVKNHGAHPRVVRLQTSFAGTKFALRALTVEAGQEKQAEYNFVTNTAGDLVAEIDHSDDLAADDRASLALPRIGLLNVAVYSDRPDVLKPLLAANHSLSVKYFRTAQYTPAPNVQIAVLDQFAPPARPKVASLWINPPQQGSPLPVKAVINDAAITNWLNDPILGAGLRATESNIANAKVFETFPNDLAVGSGKQGPLVVARPLSDVHPALAAIGFDPLAGQLKFEVTTPLLFMNLLEWLAPESSRTADFTASRVGTATVMLNPDEDAARIRVTEQSGFTVPFTVRDRTLELFASRPNILRVISGNQERVLSLTLPDVADFHWNPPQDAPSGLPDSGYPGGAAARDLWPILAILGALGLLLEWLLFGGRRIRISAKTAGSGAAESKLRLQRQRELVTK